MGLAKDDDKKEEKNDNNKKYSGKRNKGIYISKDGKIIHSDINGSYNIIRKLLNSIGIDFNYNSLNIKTRKEYYNNTMPMVIEILYKKEKLPSNNLLIKNNLVKNTNKKGTLKLKNNINKKPLRSKVNALYNHTGDAREKPIMNNKINLINLNIIEKNSVI